MRHLVISTVLAGAGVVACAPDARLPNEVGDTSMPLMEYTGSIARSQTGEWMGEVLFAEPFDDPDLESRGWYDVQQIDLSTQVHAPGSAAAFVCHYPTGARECAGGVPGRRLFDGVEEVYVAFQVRYSDDWVGSGRPYHPHEIYLLTNVEDRYAGPAYTHLTIYIENLALHGQIAIQDGANVDNRCILRNDGVAIGCNGGSVADFPFGEIRSVAACNGLVGPVQFRDCFSLGGGRWYSSRTWRSDSANLSAVTGADGWHLVETYVRLNTMENGRGVPDGAIRYAVDGNVALALDSVLLRTGAHPDMRINQILIAPYFGDGSPIDQTMWLDELVVARGRRP